MPLARMQSALEATYLIAIYCNKKEKAPPSLLLYGIRLALRP